MTTARCVYFEDKGPQLQLVTMPWLCGYTIIYVYARGYMNQVVGFAGLDEMFQVFSYGGTRSVVF